MILESKYNFGDTLYLKTDEEQKRRLLTDININLNGVRYGLCCGTSLTWHYEIEISEEKNVLATTIN